MPKVEKTEPTPTFEESLARREVVVRTLDSGNPSLAESLAAYREGVTLLAHCQYTLQTAENDITIWRELDANGQPVTEPADIADFQTTLQTDAKYLHGGLNND